MGTVRRNTVTAAVREQEPPVGFPIAITRADDRPVVPVPKDARHRGLHRRDRHQRKPAHIVRQSGSTLALKPQKAPGELDHAAADPGVAGPCSRQGQVWRALVPAAWRLVAVWPKFKARTAGWYQPASPALAHGKRPVCVVARAVATAPMRANGVVRLTCRDQRSPKRMRDHTAATTFRHSLVASARTIRSVDRETRWR